MLYCLLVVQLATTVAIVPPRISDVADDSLTAAATVPFATETPLVFLSNEYTVDSDPGVPVRVDRVDLGNQFSPLRPVSDILAELTGTISPEAGRSTGIPLFRGASPKRISVIYDGVPLSHSAQREGPSLMALGMLDPSAIGAVSFGPGIQSTRIADLHSGGVLVLGSGLDQRRSASSPGGSPGLTVSQQFSSADRGWSARASAAGESGAMRYRVGGLGRILGDLRAGGPGGESVQPYTGLRELTVHALAAYAVSEELEVRGGLLTGWRDRQPVVSDLESLRISAPPPTLDIFAPRQMTLAYVSARLQRFGLLRRASATVWFDRQRETGTFRRPVWGKTLFDDERITVFGVRGRADLAVAPQHLLGLAVEASTEGVDARRMEVRDEDVRFYQRGRFPGGTASESLDALIEDRWSVTRRTTLTGSVRFSADRVYSNYGPSVFGSEGVVGEIDRSFFGVSWLFRAVHQIDENRIFAASVGRAVSAPGLDDLASNAYWFGGRDVPNPNVGQQRVARYELFFRSEDESGRKIKVSVYRNGYENLISRRWYGVGPDSQAGTVDDLFQFTNDHATIVTGFETEVRYPVGSIGSTSFGMLGSVVAQHVSSSAEVPRFVPPVVYRAGVRVTAAQLLVESFVRGAVRTPETQLGAGVQIIDATPGWTTFNVRSAIALGRQTMLNLAVENVGDVRYREHASYLEAAGRNIILALSYSL